jgi:Protein of unknown function (DUF1360)
MVLPVPSPFPEEPVASWQRAVIRPRDGSPSSLEAQPDPLRPLHKRDRSMTAIDQQREEYFWNGIAFLIFAALCVISVALISVLGSVDIESLGFFDLAVLGLATFRLVHLVTYDKILDFARSAVMDREGTRLKIADRGWRRMLCELLACIWCTGMWSGLMLVTIYVLGSLGRFAIFVLAVAGLGSLLQIVSKAIAAGN